MKKDKLQLDKFRTNIDNQVINKVKQRIKDNPIPSKMEIDFGCFIESLEPQIKDLMIKMYKKGYQIEPELSGTNYKGHQTVVGIFKLTENSKRKLRKLGVNATVKDSDRPWLQNYFTKIFFIPESYKNIDEIKQKWDNIAQYLPDKRQSAQNAIYTEPDIFRKYFAPKRTDIMIKVLQKRLKLFKINPVLKAIYKYELNKLKN